MFFKSTNFTSDRQKWLCSFYNYLGYKKQAQTLQHTSQAKLLLEALAPKEDDLECLGADNGDAVWKRWVNQHLRAKSKAAGTLISYLTSLQMSLTYLTRQKYDPKSMPPLSPDLKVIFAQLTPALTACIDSFSQASQFRKYISECNTLITNNKIQTLHSSKPYVEGAVITQEADKGTQFNLRQFTLSREYLLSRLTMVTGTRPGALNNVLVSEYETSGVSKGNRIILMPKHKRTKDSLAMLGMDPQMQAKMAIYVNKIRPAFPNPGEDKPLIKDDGNGFQEGTTGKRVVAFFENSGVTSTRVGHTHICRFISTHSYELGNPDKGHQMEKVMLHGATTKQRCYVRANCTCTASKAMKVIASVTGSRQATSSKCFETAAAPLSFRPLTGTIEIPLMASSLVTMPLTEDHKLAISVVFAL